MRLNSSAAWAWVRARGSSSSGMQVNFDVTRGNSMGIEGSRVQSIFGFMEISTI